MDKGRQGRTQSTNRVALQRKLKTGHIERVNNQRKLKTAAYLLIAGLAVDKGYASQLVLIQRAFYFSSISRPFSFWHRHRTFSVSSFQHRQSPKPTRHSSKHPRTKPQAQISVIYPPPGPNTIFAKLVRGAASCQAKGGESVNQQIIKTHGIRSILIASLVEWLSII